MTSAPPVGRLHFLDGLRGALMIIGIPFHAAIALSGRDWLVVNDQRSLPLEVLASFLSLWRMPAFFVVAGFFAVLILHRRPPGRWFRSRLERLGVPLLAGIALLLPVEALIRGRSQLGSWSTALDSWGTLLVEGGPSHLWFLRDLLIYCAVLALVAASPWWSGLIRRTDRVVDRLTGSPLWTVAAVGVACVAVVVGLAAWRLSGISSTTGPWLTNQGFINAPFFVAGAALAVRPDRLRGLAGCRMQLPLLAAAVSLVVLLLVQLDLVVGLPGAVSEVATEVASVVGGLCGAAVLIGLALRFGDRDSVAVTWVVDSSLVVYLVHHVVVLALVAWLISTAVPALVAFVLVVVVALVVSVLAYEAINATPGLRYLFTGRHACATGLADVVRARREARSGVDPVVAPPVRAQDRSHAGLGSVRG